MPLPFKILTAIVFSLLLASCSDGSKNDPRQQIVVSASLGKITNADVSITTPAGTAVSGGSGKLDASGTATLSIPSNTPSPVVVTVSGNADARYFDESSGFEVEFPSTRRIRAFAKPTRPSVGVTTLTELASQVAEKVGANVTDTQVDSINETVRSMLAPDVTDILTPPTLVSADNINSQSLGTDEASLYALRLAALAGLGAGTDAPALTILSQLSEDLADGTIDGRGIDGAIANVNYDNFATAFSAAIQLASTTLANSDLLAQLDTVTVTSGANLLQQLVDAGLPLPTSVTDNIPTADGGTGGGSNGGTSGFDLTISGTVTTMGVGAPFSVTLNGIPAPDPGDTGSVTQAINSSVGGLSGVSGVTVTVINNSASQITFDVNFNAEQAGVAVSFALRYDYVANGNSSNPTTGGGTDGGTDGGATDGGSSGGSGGGENFCFAGEPTAATIPDLLTSEIRTLTYNEVEAGAPFANGDMVEFTFSGSGRLFLDNVEVASNPVFCGGNEREAVWKDNTRDIIYSASDLQGSFNEVNINKASDKSFFGQFREPEDSATASGPPAALTTLAGTYETQVIQACTGDTCPNTTPAGEIVTVIVGSDGTVTFAERVLSTEAEGARFVDERSSISPRLTLTNNTDVEGTGFTIETYVENDAVVAFKLTRFESCGSGCSSSKNIYTELTALPTGLPELFDKFVAASPITMTVVADDTNFSGRGTSFTGTPSNLNALCQTFEFTAAKDRAAVESPRFKPRFAVFSANLGGDDFLRRVSRYKKDDASGDETVSLGFGQLVFRADGTIDYEEGFLTSTGFITDVKDRSTNDATEITTACADFKNVSGTINVATGGFVRIQVTNTANSEIVGDKNINVSAGQASNFSFAFANGTAFEINATQNSATCTVTDGTGTVADSDITTVAVSCE